MRCSSWRLGCCQSDRLALRKRSLIPLTFPLHRYPARGRRCGSPKTLGLFEKYGLDGNLVYIASGVTSVNALLGGSVDIIAASGSSAVGAAARGAPLVIIASLGHIAYKLIAHSSITSIPGLRGKIIGSSRIGAGTDLHCNVCCPSWV